MTNWAAGMNITSARLIASTWSDIKSYTPSFGSAGSVGYTTQAGFYFTAGKLVFISAYINVGADGTGSNQVTLSLPLQPDRSQRQMIPCAVSSGAKPGMCAAVILAGTNTDLFADAIRGTTSGVSYIGTDIDSASIWNFQGMYLAA